MYLMMSHQLLTNIKEDTDSNTLVAGDFLSLLDTLIRQKINMEKTGLKERKGRHDLTDLHRTLHTPKVQFTFFYGTHKTFSKMLGRKI